MNQKFFILSKASWLVIAISCAIAGYLYWFYTHFDKVVEDKKLGISQEARADSFFAAKKFLVDIGRDAETVKSLEQLDSHLSKYDTLIMESSRVGMSKAKRTKLLEWVQAGGHLILLATEFYDYKFSASKDILLDDLGLRLQSGDGHPDDVSKEERISQLSFEGYDQKTKVNFGNYAYLQDVDGQAFYVAGNDYSDYFAQFDHGDGMISVLTDIDIWKNYEFDDYDHAMLLYQLTSQSSKTWFVYNRIQPSLVSAMLTHIPLVVYSLVIIILVTIFSRSFRRGPMKHVHHRKQRQITQHIAAAGEFSFRNDNGKELIDRLRYQLNRHMSFLNSGFSNLPVEQQLELISKHFFANTNTLDKATQLWTTYPEEQEEFIKIIRLYQSLNLIQSQQQSPKRT